MNFPGNKKNKSNLQTLSFTQDNQIQNKSFPDIVPNGKLLDLSFPFTLDLMSVLELIAN